MPAVKHMRLKVDLTANLAVEKKTDENLRKNPLNKIRHRWLNLPILQLINIWIFDVFSLKNQFAFIAECHSTFRTIIYRVNVHNFKQTGWRLARLWQFFLTFDQVLSPNSKPISLIETKKPKLHHRLSNPFVGLKFWSTKLMKLNSNTLKISALYIRIWIFVRILMQNDTVNY